MGNATQAYLRYGADQKFHLSAGRLCQIGRSLANEVVVQDAEVSRHHASVEARETEFILSDGGSRNGTYLNGTRIQGPVRLKPGDRIEVGNTQIVFEWPGAPGSAPVFSEEATIAATLLPPSRFTVVLTMNGFQKVAEHATPPKLDAALAVCREQVDQIVKRERLGPVRFAGDLVILEGSEPGGPGAADLLERVMGGASDVAIALEQLPAHANVMGRIQVSGGVWLEDSATASPDSLKQAITLAAQASKMGAALQVNAAAAERLKSRYPDTASLMMPSSIPGSSVLQFFQLQQVMGG